jgi:hypothetical protein
MTDGASDKDVGKGVVGCVTMLLWLVSASALVGAAFSYDWRAGVGAAGVVGMRVAAGVLENL